MILVVVWVTTGLFNTHAAPAENSTLNAKSDGLARVRVAELVASQRDATITVHGRTQAMHAVDVRAEVEGVVQAIHFDKGDKVKAGDVLCEIKLNDRGAKAAQAAALVAQTQKELQVAQDLFKEGFRSKTQLAQSEAAFAQARAVLATMQIQLANTRIKAPFDGFVDDRYVNAGDYMRPGDKCELVIAPEPFLAVGTVSEHEVGEIRVGDSASAALVTGETVSGKVIFVADRADVATRAFRVEIQLPNPDAKLRDGVSADIHIPVRHLNAQHISQGILVLDDSGAVGVRAVVNGIVRFMPIQIVSDGPDGTWVSGLPDRVSVITVGQQFVANGQRVESVAEKSGKSS
jgi:membrane fusion protein, multidrug efflux system